MRGARFFFVLLSVLGVSSCVRVKPYQRDVHARRTMQDEAATRAKLEEHVREYREGAIGGRGIGGGGCGCN